MRTIKCFVCDNLVPILSEINLPYFEIIEIDDRHYWEMGQMPASYYWNTEKEEVYCCAKCSLKRYGEINNVT